MSSYNDEISKQCTLRLREVQKELPSFMREFFNGVSGTISARTRLGYASDMNIFFNFLSKEAPGFEKPPKDFTLEDMEKITRELLEEYLAYLDYYVGGEGQDAPVRQNHALGKSRKLSAIRTTFRYFQRRGRLEKNLAETIENPRFHEKGIVWLEYNEVARLLDVVEDGEGLTEHQKRYHSYTKPRDLALITMMLGTGIRVSECAGIDLDHIDFENGGIKITRKGGYDSVVYFGDEVEKALNGYLDVREETIAAPGHEKALFLSLQKKRMSVRSIQLLVSKYASVVTTMKRISPHKLRSTFGTNLYRETGDIYLVADVMGHRSVETTKKHYASVSDSKRHMAARAIKLREDN